MKKVSFILTASLFAAISVLSWSSVSQAGPIAAKPDGKFGLLGDNIYNATGIGQTKTVKIRPGKTLTITFQTQNDATIADVFTLHADSGTGPFTAHYKYAGGDITPDIEAGTYVASSLAPATEHSFDLILKARASANHGQHETEQIAIYSNNGKGILDVIRVKARVR